MVLKGIVINKIPIWALYPSRDISTNALKILGAEYNAPQNVWYFPAYYPFGEQILQEIQFSFSDVVLDPTVDQFKMYMEKCKSLIAERRLKKGFTFKTTPMDHQLEGLMYAITYMRLGVFWDCGVGKTKLAVDTTRYLKLNTLYLCPSRLVENARDEYKFHSFDGEVDVFPIIGKWDKKKKRDALEKALNSSGPNPKVFIIGYETVSKDSKKEGEESYFDLVSKLPYEMLILDESHKLRDISSVTSNVISKLATKANRRMIMTGTPSLGNPLHLFVQMRLLLPWRYKNYFSFKHKYVVCAKHNKNIVIGFKNLHLINKQINQYCIQKTKEECLDLPERQVITCRIAMDEKQFDLYHEIKKGLHECVGYNPIAILIQAKLHQVCGGTLVESPIDLTICDHCSRMSLCVDTKTIPFSKKCVRKDLERKITKHKFKENPKLDYLRDLLNTLVVDGGKKVILWYRYELEYQIITEMMSEEKLHYVDYGAMGHDAVSEFQEKNDRGMVFLSQIQSSSGITLTEATYTVYYSLTFDLEHYLQSRDRMYRKGQTKKTTEYHLVMEDSVDELISYALQKKMDVNKALLDKEFIASVPRFISLK